MNNTSSFIKNLNDKQQEAVISPRGNSLVLAGAGSGKTQVLVYRTAWLLSVENYLPCSIIAVTFTNKAAAEMSNRIKHLLGKNQNEIWIGTFHGLAHRILRIHYKDVNLPYDFQVIDNDDQLRLLKRLIHDRDLDEKQWSPRQAMWYINNKKDKGLRPQNIKSFNNLSDITWQHIYQVYQEVCNRDGLVDFSELLLRTYELWLNKPHILHNYRERFVNILVDEFQDTNQIQYAWIRILAGNNSNVMIMGDDDQSIYGWRGAQVKNIQHFLDDFPSVRIIRLEQNYRSTSNILKAANTLIANNSSRLGKNLWTKEAQGEPITIYCAFDELDEAQFVINCIKLHQKQGNALKNCAILYRSNSQSRVLEEALMYTGLPYQIYGSMRFFERQEIKDAIAYLRIIANRNDDIAYERIINTPKRGIGKLILNMLRQVAISMNLTLWQASKMLITECKLNKRCTIMLQKFLKFIDVLAEETNKLPLHIQVDSVIKDSGLWDMYMQDKNENSKSRIENLKELVNSARQFSLNNKDQKDLTLLKAFLYHVTLEPIDNQINCQDTVQLMTLHSAKGLEFSKVFIVGMEEGIFPNQMSLEENKLIEEERRLAYVGITRAMHKLTITYAKTRKVYGKEIYHQPSRFISELPLKCVKKIHSFNNLISPVSQVNLNKLLNNNKNIFKLGQQVRHPKFGKGTIINLKGTDDCSKLQVLFQDQGIKWLFSTYARLEII